MFEVRQSTDAEIARSYKRSARHLSAVYQGRTVAVASLTRIDGRAWALFTTFGKLEARAGVHVVRALKTGLIRLDEPLYIIAQAQSAYRFLSLLGFRFTGEKHAGKEVWEWKPARSP